ncbi:hypothetical protein SMICM304S_06297 [Streptomyces microflavus]
MLPGGFESGAESGDGLRGAVEEFAQFRYGGEVAVGGPVGAEQLGEDGGGAAAVQAADIADEPLREDGGCLVGSVVPP